LQLDRQHVLADLRLVGLADRGPDRDVELDLATAAHIGLGRRPDRTDDRGRLDPVLLHVLDRIRVGHPRGHLGLDLRGVGGHVRHCARVRGDRRIEHVLVGLQFLGHLVGHELAAHWVGISVLLELVEETHGPRPLVEGPVRLPRLR